MLSRFLKLLLFVPPKLPSVAEQSSIGLGRTGNGSAIPCITFQKMENLHPHQQYLKKKSNQLIIFGAIIKNCTFPRIPHKYPVFFQSFSYQSGKSNETNGWHRMSCQQLQSLRSKKEARHSTLKEQDVVVALTSTITFLPQLQHKLFPENKTITWSSAELHRK